jgi:endonuclease/exonuclease/phosphatase family metal-dependent hydrolase
MFILNKIVLFFNWLAIASFLLACSSSYISPETSVIPSFFGLAFPFILFTNLAFLIYWYFFGKLRMLYSGLIIVAGFVYWNRSFNLYGDFGEIPEGCEKSKILSYNVRLFDLYNWTDNNKTKNEIFGFLKDEDADIYCFQEFFHQDTPTIFKTRDTLLQFLRAKNYAEAYTHKLVQRQFFGLAIFTTYPILDRGILNFENDKNNNALWVDLIRKTDTIRVYNIHLASIRFQKSDYEAIGQDPGPGQRKKLQTEQRIIGRLRDAYVKRVSQTAEVIEHIKKSPYKVIVAGDFNDTPVSYCYSQFNSLLNDAFANAGSGWGTTYTGRIPFLRIDYIWYSEGLNAMNFHLHHEKLSDHYPITCDVY